MNATMAGARRQQRGDTRQQIQDVALELIAEQGYERTSLREVAERLGVTKAAVYYHFKSKEEILVCLFRELTRPIEELIEWGVLQPPTLEAKQELVRRYSRALADAEPLHRFMQENQATVRELCIGEVVKDQSRRLHEILVAPASSLVDQVRCASALFTLHAGMPAVRATESDPEKRREAVLEVAVDLVTQAHHG